MDIAQKLSELMSSRQMSRGALARALGVHTSTVTNWLSGKAVKSEKLPAICDVFGCSIDYLLGTETKEKPTAEVGGELSPEAREIARAFDAAGDELRSRIKDTTFGRNNAYAAIAKIEMVCPLGYGKQTIYQPVYCVSGKTFPEARNNGCENYRSCSECEKCRADAILRAFEWDPLDCDRI
jgi:transcriptional regulator with XRE-family HTH domain